MNEPADTTRGPPRPACIARNAALGAAILGGLGFLSGFLGPLALSPDANQGPLLGIFITGPGGALLGVVLGAVTGALRISPPGFRIVVATAGTLLAGTTLFFSTPQPEYRAGILDAEIRDCAPPGSRRDKALAYWDDALARASHSHPRAGWREDLDRMLADESGVVLQLRVFRRCGVYENRKPWNRGTLEARPWSSKLQEQSYFATYEGGSCASYPAGTRALFLATGRTSHEWPPEILANFLNLQTVEPAPEGFRRLAGE